MARVDFYVLQAAGESARQQFACRLAEKAYRLRNTVHICTADRPSAELLDDLLWTFRDGSFVPHELVGPGIASGQAPVTIADVSVAGTGSDLLINLGPSAAPDSGSFPRIAEIVTSDDQGRQESRRRYAHYRELGHILETHKL
ncbi:MAG: DNA polymerase III subunit chi [Gammaproteobacteria bacterium]|nr:DNA polymerase III subunit chi [Gammaproteobacteria bacterium]MDH4253986.1 DNA polymerase III subunit chi [Gammaproteobacteria bacterium]MDH5308873.1 DNA polymerase III subunit chi [Gammaproteobacteria bacterium]